MLTTDLIRARVAQGRIIPRYLKRGDELALDRAEQLISAFNAHLGKTRGELEEAITAAIGDGTDYVLWRGLAKLLYDRAELSVESPIPCEELRRVVFEEEALRHPVVREESAAELGARKAATRSEVLAAAAARLSIGPEAVEAAMFADLEEAHRLARFSTLSPEDLLDRYNASLVQSILLRAVELRVRFWPEKPSRLRQLFRFIKFFKLMYSVSPLGGGGYSLTLDGPVSLFKLSQKYGLQLASFFPALLLCERFEMEADVLWGKEQKRLLLTVDDGAGLRSHYRDEGHYVSEEGKWLEERWAQLRLPWTLSREAPPLDLGGRGVIVPDYTLRAPDGREAFLEIVGFWRRGYLESRFELLRRHGPTNLILAVSDRLKVSDEELSTLPARVFLYKGTIIAKELLELAEGCALASKAAPPEEPPAKKPRATKKKPSAPAS